jgi:hypothetical protein
VTVEKIETTIPAKSRTLFRAIVGKQFNAGHAEVRINENDEAILDFHGFPTPLSDESIDALIEVLHAVKAHRAEQSTPKRLIEAHEDGVLDIIAVEEPTA